MQRQRARGIELIGCAFHDGVHDLERGQGPKRLLDAPETLEALEMLGRPVSVRFIEPIESVRPEAARVFELARRLADRVRGAVAQAALPIVVAGDCNSCLGTVAGASAGRGDLGVTWFDAHADFDTPDSSLSGSLDEMGLAVLTGHGWRALRETIPGFTPVDESQVILVGTRALDSGQREGLQRSRVRSLPGSSFSDAELRAALDEVRARARRAYVHVDLDCLDPSEGTANRYAVPGGLTFDRLSSALAGIGERFEIAAASVTAYEPGADLDGRMAVTAARVIAALAETALASGDRPG